MKKLFMPLLLGIIVFLAACSPKQNETNIVRVGVLPVLDTLPIYVAEAEGYFEEAGIELELVPVNSAPERDQLMQSGQIDMMLNELVSTIFFNQSEAKIEIIRYARTATSDTPIFRILASADSGITTVDELKNTEIAVSSGTVIEYTTDRILEKSGFSIDEISTIAVPKIPDRLTLLLSGELDAANLPDPVASLAILQGAVLITDDTYYPEISCSVLSASKAFTEANPQLVEDFLAAYEKAVEAINADKTIWKDLLQENGLVPDPLLDSYELPTYPTADVPTEAQFSDAVNWVLSKDLIDSAPYYKTSVTAEFLP